MKPKQQKRTEAAARDTEWRKLTPKQQLAALDRRLGKGVGAAKQRARLQETLNNVDTAKAS